MVLIRQPAIYEKRMFISVAGVRVESISRENKTLTWIMVSRYTTTNWR